MHGNELKFRPFIFAIFLSSSIFVEIPCAEGAKILFFFGVTSYSHRVPAWPLAVALAEEGHEVIFLSGHPNKTPHPKIRDYVPQTLKTWVESWGDLDAFKDRKEDNIIKLWNTLPDLGIMMCDILYQDDEYVKWVKESKIDLVIIDALVNDCGYGVAHYWKAKTILFGTTTAFAWFPDSVGIPEETSWIPMMELMYPFEMTFLQRIRNTLSPVAWHLARKWSYFPALEAITKEKLGINDLPKFEELERNTSLTFINTFYAEEFARSLPPNVIPIGGIAWVENSKPLPKDLEKFLERGDGFIYLSFGTHADFTKMDANIQEAIVGTMRNFPNIQFVWKVSNESLIEEFPSKNVYISRWMPQQAILAKAFITHSGLMGIQEAITCSVPLISFPIFAEQDYNAERIHRNEYGIRLEITTVKQSELEDAITKILTDPKYRNNMQRLSKMFKDRPMKPLEVALFWSNFVLRHNEEELASLRPANLNLPWWQKRNIDVWVTIVVSFLAILITSILIMYKILVGIILRNVFWPDHNKKKIQ